MKELPLTSPSWKIKHPPGISSCAILDLAKIENYPCHVPMVYWCLFANGSARCSAQILPDWSKRDRCFRPFTALPPASTTSIQQALYSQTTSTGAVWINTGKVQHSCQPFETRDWNPLLTGVVYKSFHLELEFVYSWHRRASNPAR